MHFSDDWDDNGWDSFLHSTKEGPKDGTAQHQKKHGQLEDAYNKRWQSIVNFGRWVTGDKSRLAGWYHSVMKIEPEPKPIRTGMTLHSLCVTHGPLRTYKLFVRAYGGRSDEDLDTKHQNTATLQKWINLYNIMLDNFKGQGHCVTINSVYMGDIMALIGRHEWKINMVGTAQENQTGADTEEEKKAMKKNTYEIIMWQHDSECLTYAIWSNNNLVWTLSNFHTPKVVDGGLNRKKKVDGVREREPAPVPCPEQNIYYSNTFHLVDKGNGVKAKYDLGGQSRKHGWTPKLSSRLFNMNFNNSYWIYMTLMEKHNPGRRPVTMAEGIKEATHSLLQRGPTMRVWALEHPSPIRDMTYVYNTGSGKRK
mmetsp:Transcript_2847/g.5763  ORF Transcript_2847/g.5763 Transcript_2847/m.5763 type:complete len:366 (+) Transcript_2847:358-1455(+)